MFVVVNLAAALSQLSFSNNSRKLRVGLMDGDIYGPSIPTLMQLTGLEAKTSDNDDDGKGYCDYYYWYYFTKKLNVILHNTEPKLIPLNNYNIKCMSMGFLMKESNAAVR